MRLLLFLSSSGKTKTVLYPSRERESAPGHQGALFEPFHKLNSAVGMDSCITRIHISSGTRPGRNDPRHYYSELWPIAWKGEKISYGTSYNKTPFLWSLVVIHSGIVVNIVAVTLASSISRPNLLDNPDTVPFLPRLLTVRGGIALESIKLVGTKLDPWPHPRTERVFFQGHTSPWFQSRHRLRTLIP